MAYTKKMTTYSKLTIPIFNTHQRINKLKLTQIHKTLNPTTTTTTTTNSDNFLDIDAPINVSF